MLAIAHPIEVVTFLQGAISCFAQEPAITQVLSADEQHRSPALIQLTIIHLQQ